MALERDAQKRAKLARVAELWARHELPAVPPAWEIAPHAISVGYRNRVRCQVTDDGGVRFFNPNKSSTCAVLDPSVLDGIAVAKRFVHAHPAVVRHFSALEVRGRDARGIGAVVFRTRGSSELPRDWAAGAPAEWLFAIRGDPLVPVQSFRFAPNCWIDVPVDAFLQVNHQVNELLVRHIVRGLSARKATSFADLYMGSGNFALPLLAAGLSGYGVERHTAAVEAAARAALSQGFGFVEAHAEDTVTRVRRWLKLGLGVDAVICNPPRSGLGPHAETVAALAKRTLVLCSCNPESLCRDLVHLRACGFEIDSLTLFDMFPHTVHVESVVWLTRQ